MKIFLNSIWFGLLMMYAHIVRASAFLPRATRKVHIASTRCNSIMLCRATVSTIGHHRPFSLSTSMSMSGGTQQQQPKGKRKEEGKYSKTVSLPITNFDQRANSLKREPELQNWWARERIYETLSENNPGEKFVLHDGPPYANGNLHIGHALNKILKDFINKYQTLRGRKVRFVPGWDCHGLPIELKVLQSMKPKERESLTPIMLRKRAAEFAKDAVANQKEAFKRYGVWGDWDNPYLTLQPEYEAAQIRVFGEMVTKKHIYRGKKPVHWSPSSRTALAEAELEYPDNHFSRSIYVGFKVVEASEGLKKAMSGISNIDGNGCKISDVRVSIWTTTPWTIPANLAIAVNPDLEYCIATYGSAAGSTIENNNQNHFNGLRFIVAKDLAASLGKKMGFINESDVKIEAIFRGIDLVGTKYQHPLYERQSDVVIGGDYITTESGTGLVHTAPGHGQEDYMTGLKYGLPLLSPVDDLGRFTKEAGERFEGLEVLGDGNKAVITALNETGTLIKEEAYNHKYPYDWRTKKPTIFRATEQWFASVSTFRQNAMDAINKVEWIPAIGKNRIGGMTETRGDWCISRQRSWGVPIPVFFHKTTHEPLLTPETIAHIENVFRTRGGSDAWWELDVAELLPEGPLRMAANDYIKGTDTMDVWFDSGTSWAGVSKARNELSYPADIYLEGSDQHRGWFQSSLLTSVASQGFAPFKTVLTHGFVLDEKGYKMSKSLGNVVDPLTVIEGGANQKENPAYGADTLRLWVSGVDYTGDVCVGDNIMKQVSDSYRKLRNTVRYLVGSLSDFDPTCNIVPYDQLPSLDRYILGKLTSTLREVESAYDSYQFYRANQAIVLFANVDLSSFYLDIAKDRLYISSTQDIRRRSCQTVIFHILEQLVVMMAPIVPHMAEDLWQNLPYKKTCKSVFQKGWPQSTGSNSFPEHDAGTWEKIRLLRNDVNKCIESARRAKAVGASQECRVSLHTDDPKLNEILMKMIGDDALLSKPVRTNTVDDLRFVLLTSQVTIASSAEQVIESCPEYNQLGTSRESASQVTVGVARALGKKCERCWYYSTNVGDHHEHSDICLRCVDVIDRDGHTIGERDNEKA